MNRRVVAEWHVARWLRVAPGPVGAALFAAFPALYSFELDHAALGGTWSDWTNGITVIAVLVLAAVLGCDVARPDGSWIWLFQKRLPASDFAMAGWLLNAGLGSGMVGWWALARYVAGISAGRAAGLDALASGCQWLAVFAVATALLYAAGALRSRHGVEILIALVAMAAFQPLASLALSPGLGTALHLLLPPLGDASALRASLPRGDWHGAAGALVHVIAYTCACLAVGTLALARWRPGEL